MKTSSIILLVLLFCSARANDVLGQLQAGGSMGMGPNLQRYLYVVTPGIRDYTEYGGAGILVFDIDNGHKFVKRLGTAASTIEKPRNIKGVCGQGDRLYFTTPEKLYCVDLSTGKTVWEVSPPNGCDRMSILPDRPILYVPSFEKDTWNVINAENGKLVTEIETKSGAHNTVVSRDGLRMYMGGLKSPNIFVADTRTHKVIQQVGPFGGAIRPFTINSDRTKAYVCVNDLLGFEIGDLRTGKVLSRIEVAGFKRGEVKRHGCPSHGIGLTPDEREVWVVDAANEHVHVFDNTVTPPKQMLSIKLREQPGWITFSIDGQYAYPSTGEVISTKTRTIVATLSDETGREVHSEKMLEVHTRGQPKAEKFGDQFGVGRLAVSYARGADGQAMSATALNMPLMFTQTCSSNSSRTARGVPGGTPGGVDAGMSGGMQDTKYFDDALRELNFCFLDSMTQVSDHANRSVLQLNFCVSTKELAALAPLAVQRYYGEKSPPISVIVDDSSGAEVTVDAVAVYDYDVSTVYTERKEACPGDVRVSPRGPRVFITGHGEAGDTPAEAVAKTMASLKKTLDWLGCDAKSLLRIRCYATPGLSFRKELDELVGNDWIPIRSVTVDKSSTIPLEIEIIAQAPPAAANAPAVEFLTPPHLKASPAFSRVVRVNRGNWTFTADVFNEAPNPAEQVQAVFRDLGDVLRVSGSDFDHFVNATYYVGNDQAKQGFNNLLPQLFNPKSLPSATRARMSSVAGPKRIFSLNAIAVTAE